MPSSRPWLCAVLATAPLLTPGLAEARFGKRSPPASQVHDATPVRAPRQAPREPEPSSRSSSASESGVLPSPTDIVEVLDTTLGVLEALVDVADSVSRLAPEEAEPPPGALEDLPDDGSPPMYPYSKHAPARVAEVAEVSDTASPEDASQGQRRWRLGVSGQSAGDGAALALELGLEGLHWGLDGTLTSLALSAEDGSGDVDRLGLYSAHLTYALVAGDRGRLRVEAGVAVADAPDIAFMGPSFGLSFERCLVGALDVEGRGQAVLVPHLQLDARAGLALHLGALTVRGGWRVMLLDDRGLVDAEAHRDVIGGPYAGLGLTL